LPQNFGRFRSESDIRRRAARLEPDERVIAERFCIDYCERYVGTLLRKLGFSHISARPRHPAQDAETIAAYKKTLPAR
jgi:transposase